MAKFTIRRSSEPLASDASQASTPTADAQTATPAPTPSGTYRSRRAVLTLLTVAGLGFWLYRTNQPAPQVSSALDQSVTTIPAADPSALVQSVLTQGEDYVATHGTFNGFNPTEPSGVLIGAAGPGMVVSVQSGTTCLYSGILPSGPRPVLSDPTLQACSAALVAQAKSTLAAESLANAKDNQATLAGSATQVETALRTWSLASGGSFAKAPTDLGITGATVLSRSPGSVVVKISSGASCEVLTVPVSSAQSPVTSGC